MTVQLDRRKPLDIEERKKIKSLIHPGITYQEIAQRIGRSKSLIFKEIRLAGGRSTYDPYEAQKKADIRKQKTGCGVHRVFSSDEIERIKDLAEKGYSLNQISDDLMCSYRTMIKFITRTGICLKNTFYKHLEERINSLEMQMEIVMDMLRELKR